MVKLLEDETADTLPPTKKILPQLDKNVAWGNSVVETDFPIAPGPVFDQTCPFDWDGMPELFDVVIGNPPYVKTEEMKTKTPEELAYYKATYKTPYRQFDKYFVFVERALQKTAANGWIGMVVPNKWITIEAGQELRKRLADECCVAEVVNFGNELIFAGLSTYICLLVLSKAQPSSFAYRHVNRYHDFVASPMNKGFTLPSSILKSYGGRAWVLPASQTEATILEKLLHNCRRLGDVVDVKNGIQTSANAVFLIPEFSEESGLVKFVRDGRAWEIEKGITRLYVNDSDAVVSYGPICADALAIFPYAPGATGAPQPMLPATLASTYPRAWEYLQHFKARLEDRDVNPDPPLGVFYAYGRHQALESVFVTPKIVYSVNQRGMKYGIDFVGVAYSSGGTAGECAVESPKDGYSLEFVLGLLNQKAIEFFVRKRGSAFGNGYFARGSAVLDDVPVPDLDLSGNAGHEHAHASITAYVKRLIHVKTQLPSATARARTKLLAEERKLISHIKRQFDALWGFSGEVDDLVLPGDS